MGSPSYLETLASFADITVDGSPMNRAFSAFLKRILRRKAVVTNEFLARFLITDLQRVMTPIEDQLFIPAGWDGNRMRHGVVRFVIE